MYSVASVAEETSSSTEEVMASTEELGGSLEALNDGLQSIRTLAKSLSDSIDHFRFESDSKQIELTATTQKLPAIPVPISDD
jgi:methyl-accepting chemotaxis protein